MSEKRFTKECGNNGMTCRIWGNGLPMTTDEVVDLLNEQQSIINKLKEHNNELKKLIKTMGELGGFNKHLIKTIWESNYDD